jgi:hypothetical protein
MAAELTDYAAVLDELMHISALNLLWLTEA